MSKKFLVITGFLIFLGALIEGGFSGIFGILGLFFDIVIIALLATTIARWIGRRVLSFRVHFLRNIFFCGSVLGFFSILLVFLAFLANTFPGALSEIQATDGKRKVVWIQMSHIGTASYYEQIYTRLQDFANKGYIIYREGVRPGTPENTARFDQMLGVKIGSGTYTQFAELLGMRAQDDSIFDAITPTQIKSVDLTLDEIVTLIGTGASQSVDVPLDLTLEFARLKEARSGPLLPYILRGVMNIVLRYTESSDILMAQIGPEVADVIIKKRNVHVIDTVLVNTGSNIVIVYGALHFQGMYELLRNHDQNWKIEKLEALYPYTP